MGDGSHPVTEVYDPLSLFNCIEESGTCLAVCEGQIVPAHGKQKLNLNTVTINGHVPWAKATFALQTPQLNPQFQKQARLVDQELSITEYARQNLGLRFTCFRCVQALKQTYHHLNAATAI
jgi:hypothetical protein